MQNFSYDVTRRGGYEEEQSQTNVKLHSSLKEGGIAQIFNDLGTPYSSRLTNRPAVPITSYPVNRKAKRKATPHPIAYNSKTRSARMDGLS